MKEFAAWLMFVTAIGLEIYAGWLFAEDVSEPMAHGIVKWFK